MTDMFELVSPEKVAAEIVKKDVKLIYDPERMSWSRWSCRS